MSVSTPKSQIKPFVHNSSNQVLNSGLGSSRKHFADRNVKDNKGEYLPIKDRPGAGQGPLFQNTRQLQEEQEKIVQEVKKKI